MSTFKHFDLNEQDDVLEIRFGDTRFFDSRDYAELQAELMQFVESAQPKKLLVHFGRIEYCSTAVMNGLIQLRSKLAERGASVKFCGMSSEVHDSFRMLKLDQSVFDIYRTREEALAAF